MSWKQERDKRVADLTNDAKKLVGRTIVDSKVEALTEEYDDTSVLVLTMSDGTVWNIVASYGDYTGNSCYEYPSRVNITLK